MEDSFLANIEGVSDLISSGENKTSLVDSPVEGIEGQEIDNLELSMSDEELLNLRDEWQGNHDSYYPKIKPRQDKNKLYYLGKQRSNGADPDNVIASNLIFEAEETFIPQALSKNPEPVVWSDNTPEGKEASNTVKSMLQYHADVLCLRRKLGVMVRIWSVDFLGIVKHGWDFKNNDIKTDIRQTKNFVFDKDAFIDEYGNYEGQFLGERIEKTAEKLIEEFPKSKEYILIKVDGKLGTKLTYTEWWTDEYCFSTFQDEVLDKHKNEYFNYPSGDEESDSATPTINHFSAPKMPYTFLSVFSFQQHPHDVTNLIEQSIPNQDRISDRDEQISKNLRVSNNSIVVSKLQGWNSENAREGAQAVEDGDPILSPGDIDKSIKRLPANALPNGILEAQENDKTTLRSVFGTQGLSDQPQAGNGTARGMILTQSHDSSRIGGGIGDALEQVADNIFNWWLQLYCVFYDEQHYGAVMGTGQAVEYVTLINSDLTRKFVVSVVPNSMQPKDEITEQNLAIELANSGWLDPINLFKKLNDPNPMETAKMVTVFRTNPQLYLQMFFPETGAQNPQAPNGQIPPQPGTPPPTLAEPPASSSLSQVPLSTSAMPQ